MSLVSDTDLASLTSTLLRLKDRVAEWIGDTEDEADQAKRFPPVWVIDATDAEYEAATAELRDEAMRQLSTSELAMEIDRRSRMES